MSMVRLKPDEWGPPDSVRAWHGSGITRSLLKQLASHKEQAHSAMVKAASQGSPEAAKHFATWDTLCGIIDGIENARSVKDAD